MTNFLLLDHFIIHTQESLDGVSKLDLWHKGNKNDGWQVDYVNVIDNKTNTSYCFPMNTMLDQNSGLRQTSVHLENPLINVSCKEEIETLKKDQNYTSTSKKLKSDKSSRNYTVRTKTGINKNTQLASVLTLNRCLCVSVSDDTFRH